MADLDVLRVRMEVDNAPLRSGMKNAASTVSRNTKQMQGTFDQSFKSMVNSTRIWVAAIAFATVTFSKRAIQMAADAEEMRSMFEAVFKGSSGDVSAWAEDLATRLGRSSLDIQEFAANFQDTFVPLGFARDEAAELSKAMTQLTLDVASFKNVRPDEAARLFSSALVGNHEAVRRFGIAITPAQIKMELLKQGFRGNADAASAQQKVLARLAIIQASTGDAMGDLERTADSTANTFLRAEAAGKDLGVTIGSILAPAAAEGAAIFADYAKELEKAVGLLVDVENLSEGALIKQIKDIEDISKDVFAEGTLAIGKFLTENLGLNTAWKTMQERLKALRQALIEKQQAQEDQDILGEIEKAKELAAAEQTHLDAINATVAALKQMIGAVDGSLASLEKGEAAVRINTQAMTKFGSTTSDAAKQFIAAATEAASLKMGYAALKDVVTDMQEPNAELILAQDRINQLYRDGRIDADLYAKATMAIRAQTENWMGDIDEIDAGLAIQQDLLRSIQDPMDAYEERLVVINDQFDRGNLSLAEHNKLLEQARDELVQTDPVLKLAKDSGEQFTDSMVDGLLAGKDAAEVFRNAMVNMLQDVLKHFRDLALFGESKQGGGGIFGLVLQGLGLFAGAAGAGPPTAGGAGTNLFNVSGGTGSAGFRLAKGGVTFPPQAAKGMTVSGPSVIAGEGANPEAILPLRRTSQGELGVKGLGGGGRGGDTYNIDARGSAPGVEAKIIAALVSLNKNLEARAVRAVTNHRIRGGRS